jgi:LAS superfamily LD-carboxypeptidase LdcB
MVSILGGLRIYDLTHPYQAKYFVELGYRQSEIEVILVQEDAIKDEILQQPYRPNIIKHLTLEHYSDLIELGYLDEETDVLLDLEEDKLRFILDHDRNEYILNWIQMETFIPSRYQRYLDVLNKDSKLDNVQLFEWVNTDRDRSYYTEIQASNPMLGTLVLVNKYHALDSDFVPSELQSIAPYGQVKLIREAAEAFKKLASDAQDAGYTIVGISGYRSYQTQATLYQRYVNKDGWKVADNYSARAGHSEHQTGLAIDVASNDPNILTFEQSRAFGWMFEHAHEYGFILRYPSGKEQITGYQYEPWHYRYVGIEVANDIKKSGMTFDEYAAVSILD